jgi:glycosyltransferase involved in cell wall biosynthesis
MAAGKPIVAADIAGIDVAIEDGKTGRLVSPGNVEALGAAIEQLLERPALAAAYGAEARRVVRERFASNVMVAQVVAAYDALLDGRAIDHDVDDAGNLLHRGPRHAK